MYHGNKYCLGWVSKKSVGSSDTDADRFSTFPKRINLKSPDEGHFHSGGTFTNYQQDSSKSDCHMQHVTVSKMTLGWAFRELRRTSVHVCAYDYKSESSSAHQSENGKT